MGVLRVKDPADPTGTTWIEVAGVGGDGPPGDIGPTGPTGSTGPAGSGVAPDGGAAGAPLRKVTATDGDVAWAGDIVMGSGEIIQFPNLADVAKINLYADTFGLGIESGTLTLYGSSRIRFRAGTPTDAARGGITSPEVAVFEAGGLGPRTTHNVTWLNGFAGTMDFRVNPAMVTMRMHAVKKNSSETGASTTAFKMCAYPTGVPAPWGQLTVFVALTTSGGWNFTGRHVMVQARTDGVYMELYGGAAPEDYNANDEITCTITWAR